MKGVKHSEWWIAALVLLSIMLPSRPARASDAYVVSGTAPIPRPPETGSAEWITVTTFFNTSQQSANGRLLGLSNGAAASAAADATFPSNTLRGFPISWEPTDPSPGLFVYHLDVPPSVLISDRLFFFEQVNCGFPACGPYYHGAVPLPVFRSLVPSGTTQVLLNADLGDSASVRTNVALYNAGDAPANATIKVRVGCDGTLVDSQTVNISPNTIIQVRAFSMISGTESCNPFDLEHPAVGSRYITVLMDQPGFSFLAVLANGTVDYTIPIAISAGLTAP